MIDQKISNKENLASRPLTHENVEKHLGDTGLEAEYASHYRMEHYQVDRRLRVLLRSWGSAHILILDEPQPFR